MNIPVLAGVVSTVLFALSMLPMLRKASRTRDLGSYSVGNLAISNAGNAFHSIYVFSLPAGPIWFLHSFYVVSAALMLGWYLRYRPGARSVRGRRIGALSAVQSPPAPGIVTPLTLDDLEVAA